MYLHKLWGLEGPSLGASSSSLQAHEPWYSGITIGSEERRLIREGGQEWFLSASFETGHPNALTLNKTK